MDVMIDLETLGTGPTAAIIQIGAVLFEPKSGGKILNDRGFIASIKRPVGDIDGETLSWWLRQESAARMGNAIAEGMDLPEALVHLDQWAGDCGHPWPSIPSVWSCPSNFDFPILDNAHRLCSLEVPWRHWNNHCARTLFKLRGCGPTVDRTGFTRHNALDDAIVQAMQVQKALA